jgi:hypothetical protein
LGIDFTIIIDSNIYCIGDSLTWTGAGEVRRVKCAEGKVAEIEIADG